MNRSKAICSPSPNQGKVIAVLKREHRATDMEPTEQNAPESSQPESAPEDTGDVADVGRSLQETEEILGALKERYEQIQLAKTQQPELEARLSELKTELETVKTNLAKTWEDLESQLVTWRDKEELFWQFLRFAGIGFALAMLINAFVK
jgi:chromosome segregation ATPase